MINSQAHHSAFDNRSASITAPGISEVIVPTPEIDTAELTLPMLAHLSRQSESRWVTLVGFNSLSKNTLSQYGFKLANIRCIHSNSDEETLWIMWEALNNGTSDFVVAAFNQAASVSNRERDLLRMASVKGHSRGLVLKSFVSIN